MVFGDNFIVEDKPTYANYIKVIGVGGGGSNAVSRMHELGIKAVDFVICNTDAAALNGSTVPNKLQLGDGLGLGAGTDPVQGRKAAEFSEAAINKLFESPTKMVFITAGMGGGTGTGAGPYIAELAKKAGMLTVAVVTSPFEHEGSDKVDFAMIGIEKLKECADTVLVVKNQRILEHFQDLTRPNALKRVDDVLANAVKCIAELITVKGEQNIDFQDVKTVLQGAGHAVMGVSEAEGPDRARIALEGALDSPLLDNNDIRGAKRILVTFTYSDENDDTAMKITEYTTVTKLIEGRIVKKPKLYKEGDVYDKTMGGKLKVTIVAAGFDLQDIPEAVSGSEMVVTEDPDGKIPYKNLPVEKYSVLLGQATDIISNGRFDYFSDSYIRTLNASPAYLRLGIELPNFEFEYGSSKIENLV